MARILIVCGQLHPVEELKKSIISIAGTGKAVVIAEAISNIRSEAVINNADLLLASNQGSEADIQPELVIYFGGQIISKRLKLFLRNLKETEFWQIDPQARHIDTFKNLTTIVPVAPHYFFKEISGISSNAANESFVDKWKKLSKSAREGVEKAVSEVGFSDLSVFQNLSKLIGVNDLVFVGNSSVVRYLQMFNFEGKNIYSNRGTSGIDGCLSTACGVAFNSTENVFAILGDLSFIYDSNGLWNKRLPKNLKIIVINNSGGGIFGMLEGPSSQDFFDEYLQAHHPVNISKLSEAFGVRYIEYSKGDNLKNKVDMLRAESKAALLEIKTPADKNPEIFRTFIKNISKQN
jgi:2-succinyl-5-enolpyruvyl-6-hydroxy-3-cyclohexene-1-carboxylate synthase